jgi:hypothetical protein
VGVADRPARTLPLPCPAARGCGAKAKANAPKVPPWANAAETPAAPAGRVTCDRPILARVAGVTERVTCRRSVSMVRDRYPSFWGDFELLRRNLKLRTATDRSESTSSANDPRGARCTPLRFFARGVPLVFWGSGRLWGPVTRGRRVARRISPPIRNVLVETFPTRGQSRKSIEEFFGRSAKPP